MRVRYLLQMKTDMHVHAYSFIVFSMLTHAEYGSTHKRHRMAHQNVDHFIT